MPKLTNLHKTGIIQYISIAWLTKKGENLDFVVPLNEYSLCTNYHK